VPIAPGVFGDQVNHDTPKRHWVTRGQDGAGLLQRRGGRDDVTGTLALIPPQGESLGHVTVEPVEVLVRIVVGIVQEWDILTSELNPEPPPLGTGEMADQSVQGQRGRRDCPLGEPFRRYARALRLERARCQSR
jgi:hypothetical protein